MNNLIMTITGPSGSGKSTLEKMLKCKGMISLISTTTRQPRAGEVNGQSYYFITKDDFKRQREQGLFVEEVEFNGEFYGLYKSEVDKLKLLNSPAVIVVEPHGKGQIEAYAKQTGLQCLRVFVDVDSQTQLERLLKRFASDFADIKSSNPRNIRAYEQLVTASAKRLAIATTEEKVWLADAYERESGVLANYDHIIKSFDSTNQHEVISKLESIVDSMLIGAPQLEAA